MTPARSTMPSRDRLAVLHAAGASLHTIASALNSENSLHPAGGRWSAAAVARYLAAA